MTNRSECAEVRLMLPELALGTVSGQDRARALKHLAGCPECRRELSSLSDVGDELLLLAPSAEPPVGFESRLMERLGPPGRRPRLWGRGWMAAAALIVIAALGGGAAVYAAQAPERDLANSYREALAVADGRYFAAKPLKDDTGAAVGHVFGYQGSPSWVFCVVRSGRVQGEYDIQFSVRNGDTWTAGEMDVPEGKGGTWAQALEVDLHDVQKISFVERSSGETLVATW
jgi:Putative zinc-finger